MVDHLRSTDSAAIAPGPDPWGIEAGYRNVHDEWQAPTAEVVAALRLAMGAADPDDRPPPSTPLTVISPGAPTPAAGDLLGSTADDRPGPVSLVLEDGTRLALGRDGALPVDLPLGYHRLEREDREAREVAANVIVSPGRCSLPADLRTWGVVAQLYAARSRRSWGVGDLGDLRTIVDWARARGAGVVGLNPLHASTPDGAPQPSPYSPSSRRWRDPLYLAIEEIPGVGELDGIESLVAAGRALNDRARLDRGATWNLKRQALDQLWERFGGDTEFDRYRREHGERLERWATFCALADHHRSGWRTWPDRYRHPDAPEVARFATEHSHQVDFWAWLQWLVDRQLAASGAGDVAIADLAVGIDGDGADAWEWQDLLAEGASVGAPPDLLGPDGQDWGLPPFIPWKLRDVAYRPLAETIRANLRHARGLRIDHVMGLFRLFWIPAGHTGADGAYVRFPGRDLLDVVALESHRTESLIVGEDLGTVEPEVRDHLGTAGVLSTRLLWFEQEPPTRWPAQAMAAVTTHDLPTVAGVWSGIDLTDQRAAGVSASAEQDDAMRAVLVKASGREADASVDEVIVDAHAALADSPSMVVAATLDDLVGAEHRPNLPGTIDQHPNWRIPLPIPLDDLDGHPLAEAVAGALQRTPPEPMATGPVAHEPGRRS